MVLQSHGRLGPLQQGRMKWLVDVRYGECRSGDLEKRGRVRQSPLGRQGECYLGLISMQESMRSGWGDILPLCVEESPPRTSFRSLG